MGEPPCSAREIDAAVCYLGVGSNLGDRAQNLARAVARLREAGEVEAVSRIYESAPVGFREQPDFYNLVVRLRTDLPPEELFAHAKQIEAEMGRTENFRNAPRVIDIDILTCADFVLHTPVLDIPHPRMTERAFVLLPLAEVARDFVHPVTRQDMDALLVQAASLEPARPVQTLTTDHHDEHA